MAYEDHWFGEPWTVPETVVMVHGNSESSRAWTCWVPHLARKYRVVRPDLPGFGESPEPPGYGWSATELAADIGRLLDALQVETCHLIGAKYGGSACMRFAIDASREISVVDLPVDRRGSRQWQSAMPTCPRAASGNGRWTPVRSRLGSTASEALGYDGLWLNEAHGQDAGARSPILRRHRARHGTRERIAPHHGFYADGDDAGKRVAIRRGGRDRYPRRIVGGSRRRGRLPGDTNHIAAVEPDLCTTRLRFDRGSAFDSRRTAE